MEGSGSPGPQTHQYLFWLRSTWTVLRYVGSPKTLTWAWTCTAASCCLLACANMHLSPVAAVTASEMRLHIRHECLTWQLYIHCIDTYIQCMVHKIFPGPLCIATLLHLATRGLIPTATGTWPMTLDIPVIGGI